MEIRSFENLSETLYSTKLPNGLTVNVLPRGDYSKSYAMFATNYGGADRRFRLAGQWLDTPAGVAHFLEHKMFDMPYGNALNLLSANGASPNAFTGSGMTAYYFECTDLFYDNLKILLEFVSTPLFTPESVAKEQGIIGQEIRMVEDSPGFVVYNNLMRCLYEKNPMRDSVAGTIESIAEITDETLLNCHKVFYNPSNMTLAVVGCVDPEKVVEMALEILPHQPGELPQRDYGGEGTHPPHQKEARVNMAVSAPQFLMGAVVEPEKEGLPRLRQHLVGELALKLLFGRSSPVYTQLRSKGLLNGAFEYELDYCAGSATILCGGESRDVSAVLAEFRAYRDKLLKDGLSDTLFESARKALFGNEIKAMDSFAAMAQALVNGAFAGYCPLDGPKLIEELTPREVLDFIQENLTDDKLALSLIDPL